MTSLRAYPLFILLLLGACQREELQPSQPDTIPPLPPAALEIDAAHDGVIMFSWLRNTEQDIDTYIVYRHEPAWGDFRPVDTTADAHYIDIQRSYDTTYGYYVEAVDRSGNRSAPSAIISTSSPNLHAPDAPAFLYASGHYHDGRRYFLVEWPEADEYDIAAYAVYASGSPDVTADPRFLLANTEATSLIDTTRTEFNQVRYYAVTVIDRGRKVSPLSPVAGDYITRLPVLVSPADNAPIRDYPVFSWERVPGAVQYRLSVMGSITGDELWSALLNDTGVPVVSAVYSGPSLYTGKTYYWRVSTLTRHDRDVNAVSAIRAFRMEP